MMGVGSFTLGMVVNLAVTLLSNAGGLVLFLLALIGLITGMVKTKHKMVEQDFLHAKTLKEKLRAGRGITHRSEAAVGHRALFPSVLERVCLGLMAGFFAAILIDEIPWFADNYEAAQ